MLAEDGIAVGIDVLGVLEPQFQHRRYGVLEAVGAYEVAGLGHLLDCEEGGVDAAAVGGLVLLLDDGEQDAFGLLEGEVLFLLYDALQLIERVDCHYVPALLEGGPDGV